MKTDQDVFNSCEEANEALGPCENAKSESDGGHWWYIDHELEDEKDERHQFDDWIECRCGTCHQRMRLSADAEEYPL